MIDGRDAAVYQPDRAEPQTAPWRLIHLRSLPVNRNVWFLGLTSLFTDVSSEMVSSVLPAYLVLQLGVSPMVFGAIDGLYHGIGSLVRWIGGAAADHSWRHKELASLGYALSAACRIGLLLAGTAWTAIAALVAIDRISKGFRTAPRDALIALSTPATALGLAFGVHRMMDALGALAGPVVAFAILAVSPRGFDLIFVVSFSVALVGLACILLFVENVAGLQRGRSTLGSALFAPFADTRFRRLLVVACVLALGTVSDAFVYLLLQRHASFGAAMFPLLAALTAASYTALSIPAGRAADQVGRSAVFIAGHVLLLGLYGMLWLAGGGWPTMVGAVLLLGGYYAATDGVLAATASGMLAGEHRGSGLAILGTGVSLSRLVASVLFGYLWGHSGTEFALGVFTGMLGGGILLAIVVRQRPQPHTI